MTYVTYASDLSRHELSSDPCPGVCRQRPAVRRDLIPEEDAFPLSSQLRSVSDFSSSDFENLFNVYRAFADL